MEMKLKLAFHIGTRDQKTVELDKEDAKELYDALHEMFGEKVTKWEYVPSWPTYPLWNQPFYASGYSQATVASTQEITITNNAEWHSKDSGITASFTEKL